MKPFCDRTYNHISRLNAHRKKSQIADRKVGGDGGEVGSTLIETVSFELQDAFVFRLAHCVFCRVQEQEQEHTIECMESLFAYNRTPVFPVKR